METAAENRCRPLADPRLSGLLKLTEREQHTLLELLAQTCDFVGVADSQGKLKYHNPAALRLVGLPEDADLSDFTIADMHPAWAMKIVVEEAFPTAMERGIWRGETALLHCTGREIPVSQIVMAHQGLDGKIESFSTIMRVTYSKSAVEQIVRYSGNMIIATEVDGTIRVFNRAAERCLGYRADEVVGKTTPEVFHDKNEMIARAELLSLKLGRVIPPTFRVFVEEADSGVADQNDWTYIRKDGSRFPVLLSVTTLHDPEGRITGYLGNVADITEQKRLEAELKATNQDLSRSNQELAQFAYVASHDLQAPLRTIRAFSGLIAKQVAALEDAELTLHLQYVTHAAERMQALISDLLAYAKVKRGRTEAETVNLKELVDELLETGAVPTDGAEFSVLELPRVEGYRLPLRQMMQNLLHNAQKFRRPGVPAKVRVFSRERADDWVISVSDNGIGIAATDFPRLFRLFERLSPNDAYDGTGIGLAICKKVAELHGGTISLESVPDEGTTFHVLLPKGKGRAGALGT